MPAFPRPVGKPNWSAEIEAILSYLDNSMIAEIAARSSADTSESTARQNADTAEATARANADTTEANTRLANDNTEIAARIAGDQGAYKNKVRNGDMGVSQRGNGPWTGSAIYTVDGWMKHYGGGGTHTVSRLATTVGGTNAVSGANYLLRSVVTGHAVAADYAVIQHRIEGVRSLAGKQVTLSFYAASASGTPSIGIETEQNFGTGGSPSATAYGQFGAIPNIVNWNKYSVTFTVPSIFGKTLGTNDNDYLAINLWVSAGSTYNTRASNIGPQNNTFDITDIQLEIGSVVTPFERLSIAAQLAWCQRYFYRMTNDPVANATHGLISGMCTAASQAYLFVRHPVRMRSSSVIGYSLAGMSDLLAYNAPACTFVWAGTGHNHPDGGLISANQNPVVGNWAAHWPATLSLNGAAAYFEFSAEL